MRPVAIASNTGKRPPRSRPCTSAVMKTVLPAFDRPVTPSLIVGSNRWLPNSASAAAASRICSKSSSTIGASVCWPGRAGEDDPYSENHHRLKLSETHGVRIQLLRPAQGKNVARKLYTRDEARLTVANAAKLPALLRKT